MLVHRAKFAPHIMVSAGVSFKGKGLLHFVEEKAKINASYYIDNLLSKLVEDAHALLGNNFVFQQDGAPAHGPCERNSDLANIARTSLTRIKQLGFKSAGLLRVGTMLEEFNKFNSKPQNTSELKIVLQTIWDKMPDETTRKAITGFRQRLKACVSAGGTCAF